jgi:predicted DNA-binding transcriptional regulator AlpA
VRLFVPAAIAEHLGIARSSVYRMLAMPHERQFPLAMSVHTTTELA